MSFYLQRQDLSVRKINFSDQSFNGTSKLIIYPLNKKLKTIVINCCESQINHIYISTLNSENNVTMTTKTTHDRISKDKISIIIPEKFKEKCRKFNAIIHSN